MYTADQYFSNLTIRHIGSVKLFHFRGASVLDEGSHLKLGIDSCLIVAIAQQEILSVEFAKFWYEFVVSEAHSIQGQHTLVGTYSCTFSKKGCICTPFWGKPQGFN